MSDNLDIERYARQISLYDIGLEGQLKIRDARVCLIGVGGLGCPTALQLTGLGVGYLRIVDRDTVSKTDLHRQYLYTTSDVGLPKVEAAHRRLKALNPDVEVEPIPEALTPWNAKRLIDDVDVVVDGLDRISYRYVLNRACVDLKIPYVFGAAIELMGSATTIIPNETACLECIYPSVSDDSLDKCAVVGVHPSILSIVSSIQVSEAVRVITGKKPHLASKLLFADLSAPSFDFIEVSRSEVCGVCGSNRRLEEPRSEVWVEESCARDGRGTFFITPSQTRVLDLDSLKSALTLKGYRNVKRSLMAVSFDHGPRLRVHILRSGAAVVQVSPPREEGDREEAYQAYLKALDLVNTS
ncbi:MAG: HesA/MoeB/ThiF family protein [Nitrososphaerales archaeon]